MNAWIDEENRAMVEVFVPSPEWHRTVLEERERRLASGEATVSSLEDVRKRLEKLGQ